MHLVTVNDYLAKRDAEWMGPVYRFLGVTVGVIQSNMPQDARKAAYDSEVTYGTNSEFGFDYLRDNLAVDAAARSSAATTTRSWTRSTRSSSTRRARR